MSSLQSDQKRLEYPLAVSPTYPVIAPPCPCHPGSSIPIDGHLEGLLTEKQAYHGKEFNKGGRSQVINGILPDVVLLKIFDFYADDNARMIEAWCILVHVCQKWRQVVFGSPRRLNLRLLCTHRTPVRKMLHIWPLLPIVLSVATRYEMWDADEIIAALEHNDRICQIHFHEFPRSVFKTVFAATQHPFPALTQLVIKAGYTVTVPILPDSFLGGSAPRLRTLHLDCIPFPGLPKLLLSATHLVHLDLSGIPDSGYIFPEAMVTGLSALTSLETLRIVLGSSRSHPDWNSRRPPRLDRTLLPALTRLVFGGVSEYFEDLVAQINAPLLDKLFITFHQPIFDTPQLAQFISRTPKFEAYDEVRVTFDNWSVNVAVPQAFGGSLRLGIPSGESDEQLSSVARVCGSSFPRALISMVENLYIKCEYWDFPSNDDIENRLWLEFLHPFTAVKDLYISWKFTPSIASALQDLSGERATEVLPALQSLFLGQHTSEDSRVRAEESIGQFVSARLLAGHPIAVSRWEGQ